MITLNTQIKLNSKLEALSSIKMAVSALQRDIANTCYNTAIPGMDITLEQAPDIKEECFIIKVKDNTLSIVASDELGFIYGIYHVSKTFLGVHEFWFWNEQKFTKKEGYEVPSDYYYASRPFAVRFRGWFVNDEVLIDGWQIDGSRQKPWEMVFEALLRCGGNMTIPGTDENAHIYCDLASKMGLWITHHHAEPLGAQMFLRAYPDLEASYDKHPDLFEKLWIEAIERQKGKKVLWNVGFRGQGDRPFWADDPAYDTDEKRGRLISKLIRRQIDLLKSYDKNAICCSNLYGETMELYKKGLIDIPEDVIFIWADNGFGKMVSRRQGNHNPRVPALPEVGAKGRHGIYYHASFYDLQAAAQMTMFPNSPVFVARELARVCDHNAKDYWIINCSNVKPHAYILALIARLWENGADGDELNLDEFCTRYCSDYFGQKNAGLVSDLYKLWPSYCPKYGPNEDDRAGEQFAQHGARVLMTGLVTNYNGDDPASTRAAAQWRWFSGKDKLIEQVQDYKKIIDGAVSGYRKYLDKCLDAESKMDSQGKELLEDLLIWQVQYHYYGYLGALHICKAIEKSLLPQPDFLDAFYEAGLAAKAFRDGYDNMRSHEKGVFVGFFDNDCEADIRQSYYASKSLMGFLRFHGDGPHFYEWQRRFQQGAGGEKVHLILRIRKHLTDDELWKMIHEHKNRPSK